MFSTFLSFLAFTLSLQVYGFIQTLVCWGHYRSFFVLVSSSFYLHSFLFNLLFIRNFLCAYQSLNNSSNFAPSPCLELAHYGLLFFFSFYVSSSIFVIHIIVYCYHRSFYSHFWNRLFWFLLLCFPFFYMSLSLPTSPYLFCIFSCFFSHSISYFCSCEIILILYLSIKSHYFFFFTYLRLAHLFAFLKHSLDFHIFPATWLTLSPVLRFLLVIYSFSFSLKIVVCCLFLLRPASISASALFIFCFPMEIPFTYLYFS